MLYLSIIFSFFHKIMILWFKCEIWTSFFNFVTIFLYFPVKTVLNYFNNALFIWNNWQHLLFKHSPLWDIHIVPTQVNKKEKPWRKPKSAYRRKEDWNLVSIYPFWLYCFRRISPLKTNNLHYCQQIMTVMDVSLTLHLDS